MLPPFLKKLLPLQLRLAIRNIALAGDTYFCPCCGKSSAVFLPFGMKKRPHAECPHCQSLERHRLLWLFLKQETDLFSGQKRVLHVAPEPIFFKNLSLNPLIHYIAGDKFDEGYHYPNGTINMDVTGIPFPDQHFDVIICNHVLEHVPDDRLALREIYRVLRPEGWAIIQSPMRLDWPTTREDLTLTDPAERTRLFGQPDHVRLYGQDYGQRLAEPGFEVKEVPYIQHFTEEQINYMGLQQADSIFYCRK